MIIVCFLFGCQFFCRPYLDIFDVLPMVHLLPCLFQQPIDFLHFFLMECNQSVIEYFHSFFHFLTDLFFYFKLTVMSHDICVSVNISSIKICLAVGCQCYVPGALLLHFGYLFTTSINFDWYSLELILVLVELVHGGFDVDALFQLFKLKSGGIQESLGFSKLPLSLDIFLIRKHCFFFGIDRRWNNIFIFLTYLNIHVIFFNLFEHTKVGKDEWLFAYFIG